MTPRKEVDRSRIADTTPVRLALAAELAFPDGSVTAETLRREMAAGRLTGWKVGNKLLTSQAEIVVWLDRCRVEAEPRQVAPRRPLTDRQPHDASLASLAACKLQAQFIIEKSRQQKAEEKAKKAEAAVTRRQP